MIGGRINVFSPIEGLHFGFSGYHGTEEESELEQGEDEEEESEKSYTFGADIEFLTGKQSVRCEATRHVDGDGFETNSFYVESARYLTQNWQVAARYERSESELPDEIDTSSAPSLLDHSEFAVGLNYWFTHMFVLKLSYQMVDEAIALPGRKGLEMS